MKSYGSRDCPAARTSDLFPQAPSLFHLLDLSLSLHPYLSLHSQRVYCIARLLIFPSPFDTCLYPRYSQHAACHNIHPPSV
jgi:hypothetical protein